MTKNKLMIGLNKAITVAVVACLLVFVCVIIASSALAEQNTQSFTDYKINNSHKNYKYSYKGNFHSHTANSPDSSDPVQTAAQWYKDNGYYTYAITDHDYVTPDPKIDGLTWIGDSEEDSFDGSGGHIGHLDIKSPITSGTRQERVANAIIQGGFSIFNHPTRSGSGFGDIHIADVSGAIGMEVYNGKSGIASVKWDAALTYGKKLWGFADDDGHEESQRGNGYNVINTKQIDPSKKDLIKELRAGNFYASRGLDVKVTVKDKKITAKTSNGSAIRWIKQFGEVIKTTNKKQDSYRPGGGEKYIRIEILDNQGQVKAWSQPLFISGIEKEYLDLQVASGVDDGAYSVDSGFFDNDDEYGRAGNLNSSGQGIYARFTGVDIGRKAKIAKAYLVLGQNTNAISTETKMQIQGAKEANSSWIEDINDLITRPRTTAQVSWQGLDAFQARDWISSPDITSIVQEIVNQDSWARGSALQLFLEDNSSISNGYREFMFFEHNTYKRIGAPRLVVFFDRQKPRTYAPRQYKTKRTSKGVASTNIYWRVNDDGNEAYVKIKIKKKVPSKIKAKLRKRYLNAYKSLMSKYQKSKNKIYRKKYIKQARIYHRRYKRMTTWQYKYVKTVKYGWTNINKLRKYIWQTKIPGDYVFYVYAKDTAQNMQHNIAKNYLVVE